MPSSCWLIRLELAQVQKFIFRVPRLKAMVGANRLLGQLLQETLPGHLPSPAPPLPPAPDWRTTIKGFEAVEQALLGKSTPLENMETYFSRGIIHAAGGHFECLLSTKEQALEFLIQARESVGTLTPGLKASCTDPIEIISGQTFGDMDKKLGDQLEAVKYLPTQDEAALPGFPFQHRCAEAGREVAVNLSSPDKKRIGPTVDHLFTIARQPMQDLGSRIENLIKAKAHPNAAGVQLPLEFDNFFGEDESLRYLAVIHTDTNRMGATFGEFRGTIKDKPYFEAAQAAETFYARNRVSNRQAVMQALLAQNLPPGTTSEGKNYVPWRILMLGGDDLLMVMRAWEVFPFLVSYARWYEFLLGRQAGKLPLFGDTPPAPACRLTEADRTFLTQEQERLKPLSFKAGVAIVPVNFPFATAYGLAEELASSARDYAYDHQVSAVDWALVTTPNIDDLDTLREREHTVYGLQGKHQLRRPRAILQGCGPGRSLEALWDLAGKLQALSEGAAPEDRETGLARNKLKHLRTVLHQGPLETELSAREYLATLASLGREVPAEITALLQQPWEQGNGTFYTDLLEIVELADLAAKASRPGRPGGAR